MPYDKNGTDGHRMDQIMVKPEFRAKSQIFFMASETFCGDNERRGVLGIRKNVRRNVKLDSRFGRTNLIFIFIVQRLEVNAWYYYSLNPLP